MSDSARATLRDGLAEAVTAGDRARAVDLAIGAIAGDAVTVTELHTILGDLLRSIGAGWRAGTTSVWQEHAASAVVRTVIEALHPLVRARAVAPNGRTVVLACPEDEVHDLGLRMLSDRLELVGWTVCYLGADTPAGEIASAALATGASLIVLSASTHFHVMRLRTTLEVLEADAPGVRVLVGGAATCGDGASVAAGHLFDPAEFFPDDAGPAPACEGE